MCAQKNNFCTKKLPRGRGLRGWLGTVRTRKIIQMHVFPRVFMLLGRFPGPPSRQDAELSRAVRPTAYQFLAPRPFCALLHKMGTLQGQGLYLAPEAYLLCAEVQETHGIVAPDPLFVQHAKIPSSPEQEPQPARLHFFCAHKKENFCTKWGRLRGHGHGGETCWGSPPWPPERGGCGPHRNRKNTRNIKVSMPFG